MTVMESCLHGEEKRISGDKGSVSETLKAAAEARGVTWRVLRKATTSRKLNCADMSFNKKSNRTRARVEHVFGVIKNLWGYRKVRYKGLAKNAGQVYTMLPWPTSTWYATNCLQRRPIYARTAWIGMTRHCEGRISGP